MTLILHAAMISDPGLVRTNNEDAAYAGDRLLAVADGIGGQPSGEVASDIAISTLAPLERSTGGQEPVAALRGAVEVANRRIREMAQSHPESEGMGTTVTALLLTGDEFAVVHAGDSRGYLLRDGALHQLTRDDTFVQELVDRGVLTPEEARYHPQRSLVTRAVQGAEVPPDTWTFPARAGDRLLLCSDGLSDYVEESLVRQALTGLADRYECAEQLVKLAHQAGAPDNVTVVIADLTPST
ncbi:PP2C family serine/threonine-protein phosphatase [Micromonospora sp. NPDC049559]|uniref:PP2C family protein-serine/threonine phosphatase n=1 Tax=Micromonospora sp. NPDC049559 TaxID=3155923 RepID=UPI0034499221